MFKERCCLQVIGDVIHCLDRDGKNRQLQVRSNSDCKT